MIPDNKRKGIRAILKGKGLTDRAVDAALRDWEQTPNEKRCRLQLETLKHRLQKKDEDDHA